MNVNITSQAHPANLRMKAAGCPAPYLIYRLADVPGCHEIGILDAVKRFAQGQENILFIAGKPFSRSGAGTVAARARLAIEGGSFAYLDGQTLPARYKRADFEGRREILETAVESDILLFDSFASMEMDDSDLELQAEIVVDQFNAGRAIVVTSKNTAERLGRVAGEINNGLFTAAVDIILDAALEINIEGE